MGCGMGNRNLARRRISLKSWFRKYLSLWKDGWKYCLSLYAVFVVVSLIINLTEGGPESILWVFVSAFELLTFLMVLLALHDSLFGDWFKERREANRLRREARRAQERVEQKKG